MLGHRLNFPVTPNFPLISRRGFGHALAALAFLFLGPLFLIPPAAHAQEAELFEKDTLVVRAAAGELRFRVEVAATAPARSRGLMHREYLAPDAGMLFDFKRDAPINMWMKNTLIPLDMLFIDRNGKIVSIAQQTEPLSLRHIPSAGVVRSVLEINGGAALRLGIAVGDRVVHSMFSGGG